MNEENKMTKSNWLKISKRYGVIATASYMRDLGYPLYMTLWILGVK